MDCFAMERVPVMLRLSRRLLYSERLFFPLFFLVDPVEASLMWLIQSVYGHIEGHCVIHRFSYFVHGEQRENVQRIWSMEITFHFIL